MSEEPPHKFVFNPSSGLVSDIHRRGQMDAKISKRTAKEREQFRKDQTRRKIIAGAIVLKHAEKNPKGFFSIFFWWLLDQNVHGQEDREKLFGLKLGNRQDPRRLYETNFENSFANTLDKLTLTQ